MKKIRRFLLIVVKNISVLDYAAPLLWKIKKEDPDAQVSVLYCSLSRGSITRNSRFYTGLFKRMGIHEHDYLDFLRGRWRWTGGLCRNFFRQNPRDFGTHWGPFGPCLRQWGFARRRAFGRLGDFLLRKVAVKEMLDFFDPDVVLLDHRTSKNFHGHELFIEYFYRSGRKIILLPHAPHHTGTEALTPFCGDSYDYPENSEYWLPFKHDRPWVKLAVEKRRHFFYVGYPGLDTEWLDWVMPKSAPRGLTAGKRRIRILLIIRKYLQQADAWPAGHDGYLYTYEEFTHYMRLIREAVDNLGVPVELAVKPHPSNNFRTLKRTLRSLGFSNVRVARDSIYREMAEIDIVVSLYSTTPLIPAMAGIPVILVHSRMQDEIFRWPEMRSLYSKLRFYVPDPQGLPRVLADAVRGVTGGGMAEGPQENRDVSHLRDYLPDRSLEVCLARIDSAGGEEPKNGQILYQ